MPQFDRPAYSYRDDPSVPTFDDSRPLFLFDGVCVLCSTGVAFLMRHDRQEKIALASAQSPIGSALFRHYGMEIDSSYLLVAGGLGFTKTDGYFRLFEELGGAWRLWLITRLIPRPLRDWVYDRVATNRYSWFGKTGYCQLLSEEQQRRLLDQ